MVDRLSTATVTQWHGGMLRLLCAAVLSCAVVPAYAETPAQAAPLPDPTRPPTVAPGGEGTEDAKSNEPPPAGLQTVMLRKGAKPLAIINGQTVELGGKVGDARLVRLSETEAELQGPNGKEVLHLIPGAERKPVVLPEPVADAKSSAPKKNRTKLTK